MRYLSLKFFVVICIFISFGTGCVTSYSPGRVYIPQHSKAKVIDVQASTSQSHIGYALSNQFSLHAGGYYTTANSNTLVYEDSESTLKGGELGLHYRLSLNENFRVSAGFAGAVEHYAGTTTKTYQNPNSGRIVTDSDEISTIILRPSAQFSIQGFTNSKSTKTFALFARIHHPMIEQETLKEAYRNPIWLDLGLNISLLTRLNANGSQLGIYTQVLATKWLTEEQASDIELSGLYRYIPLSVFFGLDYKWDGGKQSVKASTLNKSEDLSALKPLTKPNETADEVDLE